MPVDPNRLCVAAIARSRMHGDVENAAFVRAIFSSFYRGDFAIVLKVLVVNAILLHGLSGVVLTVGRWWWGGSVLVVPLAHVIANTIEMVAQSCHTRSREDAEDVTLMLVEFRGSFATVDCQVLAKKGLNARQAQVSEPRAVVEQVVNAL